ncbi:hypothetical protein [Marinimicrobium sp. ABcell2]|uniref:hypothetical protein n=1 Tax=Marinimicrobium sp. ABcell2 TaxID=3069751 RepID=UPI0027B847F7|nr:hypothetical protein [Marinimicrobium sp. ABcell2]MDQ2077196.1 hypothetical protein [Marinimicrobium sp. ABcell2]
MRPSAPSYLADFDSASAMLRATSNILNGKDFPTLGQPPALTPLVRSVNLLPRSAREQIYALGGAFEGQWPTKLHTISAEAVAEWAAARYPQRPYQAVMVGSSNGALVHLAAALDLPWLPQTSMIPVRHFATDPDDPKSAMEFGKRFGPALLDANPEWQLHHMHDANQDRLMVRHMDYFRVKRLNLGRAYERFLTSRLPEGGTIILVDCQRKWPTTRINEHHVFQHGALGGATEHEFMEGSERVEEYLHRYDSDVRRWDGPEPNDESPEAEWGFEQALREDVLRFAAKHGYKVKRLSFYEPEHTSPLVADFYRDWYRLRGLKANRLLVESFISMEPYWALRTGSVPFWMKFNMEPSVECVEKYLDNSEPFDEINLMLFNNGVEAAGFPQIDRWKKVLERARRRGRFIGVRPDLHPRDFGALARYHTDMKKLAPRYPIPGPLPLKRFTDFMQRSDREYAVKLEDE